MINRYRKLIALVVISTFLVQDLAYAAPELSLALKVPSQETSVTPERIQLPLDMGTIEEEYAAPKSRGLIVHVRDAHGSQSAQRNTERILEYLQNEHGIELALLEGGQGRLRPETFRFFNDPQVEARIRALLMERAELSGAEAYLIQHPTMRAFGLEDAETYRQDLDAFRSVLLAQEDSNIALEQWHVTLRALETHHHNKDLQGFINAWRDYHQREGRLLTFGEQIRKAAKSALEIDLNSPQAQWDYPAMVRVTRLRALESQIDHEQVEEEEREGQDVIRPFPQRQEMQFKALQTEQKIATERIALYAFFQVSVCRGKNSAMDLSRL